MKCWKRTCHLQKQLSLQAALPPIPSLFPPAGPAAYLALTMVRPLCPPVQLIGFARGKEKKKEERKKNKRFVLNYLHQGLLQVPLSAEGQGQCWGLDKWAKAVLWRRRSKAFHFAALCFLKNNYHCFLNSFFAIYLSDYPRQKLFLTKTC